MPPHPRLIALAGAAGCLDATSFLGLQSIFPANQTGNTALLGIAVGRGDWAAVARTGTALLAFCVGVVLLGLALRRRPAQAWGPEVTAALGVEVLLLAGVLAVWDTGPVLVSIALAALAMGVQSLSAGRAGVPGVSTTFVTGTLTRLGARIGGGVATAREDGTPALVWVAYLAGAVAGGAASELVGGRAGVALVIAVVAAVVVLKPRPRRAVRHSQPEEEHP